ncbi:MAG: hypothetical protein MJZ06_00005 [Bacteroidaceae bacterium]|nr:hypothetical protein [Bacteroidaceae bacterium]
MKAHPSIAFNNFSGTSGEVTSRDTKNGTVLSVRAKHAATASPQQKSVRAIMARVGRRFRYLTAEQAAEWNRFAAQHYAGEQLTGCNVFVRLNCNRAMMGLELLLWPPADVVGVPDVIFQKCLVTPSLVQFTGIEFAGDGMRLAVGMSNAVSPGVSYGVGRAVILDPDFIPTAGRAVITEICTERLGVEPVPGLKYFLQVYWIDRDTGFAGNKTVIDRICLENI